MPVQTSQASFPDSFPSFMSVFGGPLPRYKEDANTIHPLQYPTHVPVNTRLLPSPHRESVSSMTSVSTESSPTTTISHFDSPGGGDISPSSSPESPSAMSVSYPKCMPSTRPAELPPRLAPVGEPRLSQPAPHHTRSDSPNRRARNLKNLSLRMPSPSQSCPPLASASALETTSKHHLDALPSPVPILSQSRSTRRRAANLTIQTPTFVKPLSGIALDVVPPTPSLRHAESSPSLASMTSPSLASRSGMQLPRLMSQGTRRFSSASAEDAASPVILKPVDGSGFSRRVLDGLEEEDDHLDSRESTRKKDRGYPDGPIRIHDSGVYLYLEPTAEEASKFDVVINVAKEVVNPFSASKDERNDTVMSTWRNTSMVSHRFSRGEPQTAISEISFKSAWEYQPSDSESPSPTAESPSTPAPEYLHVSWDHNSEILEDLLPLCELIDDRIAEGKKVLVHCQLGASRSASLVIAYGLYKNRHLDFNSMYEAVKGRSQWVGPNMSLIYQLTDFRSKLLRGSTSKPPPQEWFVQTGRRSSEPQVAQAERAVSNESSRPSFRGMSQASSICCLSIPETSSTRPTTSDDGSYTKFKSYSPKRSLSPRPLPFRQKFQSVGPAAGRLRGLPRSVTICDPLGQTRFVARDTPECGDDMFSPRTNEFFSPAPVAPRSFHRIDRSAALFSPPTPHAIGFAAEPADPRSPPSGGEPLIMRSIDEFL
ncbi:Protein-tyrosine phosphatase, putative [Penicillium digitatum]|uniref:protein-tyrosine-phosphatase n=3 Tax=Penicillium digitatum TaxID=36651 RepID=K9FJN2_PEND2|nr:Protein-tyrosine phosphatase, putative [Penicillium digitatum Pd1]EKV07867.1 Protein-tyrosine phosphatase, putative [Penicillium digitatum Pd1]EKV09454.1 Protein-tyrosine phosphatase, putative [Penicillium digitatum PHI26]QQK41439.1 Protein-tyrosine phosphatase, putative [Penicillium digitatum]